MTVEQYIAKAVALIDDTANVSDYNTGYFAHVNSIVNECINLNIGSVEQKYVVTVDANTAYAYTSTDGKPVAMPADLTSDEQIVDIALYGTHAQHALPTETVSGVFYLLIPDEYSGDIVVRYKPAAPDLTSLTNVVPLSTGAINTVAVYGLAALLALANSSDKVNYFEQKYAESKAKWKPRKKSTLSQVVDVYGY